MNNVVKYIYVLFLFSFLIVGLSGCGTSGSSGSGNSQGQLNLSGTFLTWKAPTSNADGSQLTDLSGFLVYYGTASRNYMNSVDVGTSTSYSINLNAPGATYYFAVKAYDAYGNLSDFSNEISTKL
jgi:hypothetical protein